MMKYDIELNSPAETQTLAMMLAELAETGDVIALRGEPGAGKTEFARAFIRFFMGNDEEVPSPTFNLVHVYEPQGNKGVCPDVIWHFDLYRMEDPDDVWELGLEEALGEGITLIEWPEKLEGMGFKQCIELHFVQPDNQSEKRRIGMTVDDSWKERIESLETE